MAGMGLLGAYVWYRHGKKKAQRRARREREELEDLLDEADDVCEHCGYTRAQHSDEGYCPRYG